MTAPIYSHTYPNGLVLLAEPMLSLESAAFTFLLPVGSAHDPPQRSGLASFACEMALRGAGERDSHQFILDLDNLGVEHGESVADIHTTFSGATVATNLPEALALYADLLRRPHLPAEDLEAVRQLMLHELQAVEDEPAHKLMTELRRRRYPHPWGQPSHGERSALLATTLADIRQYFAAHYHATGTILGVAGHFDWEALKDTVGQLLGDWPSGERPAVAEGPAGPRSEHIEYSSGQTQIGIAYPSVPYRDPDYFQAWGAMGVLSAGTSARLFTEVRERRGLCYAVHASYHSLRDRGAVFCYAGTSAERAQETFDVTCGELLRLAEGVQSSELDRLKARIKSSLIMQQESSSSRSAAITRDWLHLARVRTLEELGRLVDELSCHSINTYLADHPPGEFNTVTLGPQELEVPVGVR